MCDIHVFLKSFVVDIYLLRGKNDSNFLGCETHPCRNLFRSHASQ